MWSLNWGPMGEAQHRHNRWRFTTCGHELESQHSRNFSRMNFPDQSVLRLENFLVSRRQQTSNEKKPIELVPSNSVGSSSSELRGHNPSYYRKQTLGLFGDLKELLALHR